MSTASELRYSTGDISVKNTTHSRLRSGGSRLAAFGVGLFAALCSVSAISSVPIDRKPMTVSNTVRNNFILAPSFEWPTAITHANDPGASESNANYSASTTYAGYFNPNVCYDY